MKIIWEETKDKIKRMNKRVNSLSIINVLRLFVIRL